MVAKTEIKTAQIPDDVKPYIPEIIGALRRALEIGEFNVVVGYDVEKIETLDIKAYVSKNHLYITYKDIDIVYSDYVAVVKVYRNQYVEHEIYYAHEYWSALEELHELAREKVKERLEEVLRKI
jgi:hypothetical protein